MIQRQVADHPLRPGHRDEIVNEGDLSGKGPVPGPRSSNGPTHQTESRSGHTVLTAPQLKEKARGALLGAAVGDALGAPFEGLAAVDQERLKRLLVDPGPMRYTDDTHMTIGMAESLVERRGFDGAHMAQVMARNYAQEPWRGYGLGPPQVFRLLEQGVPWDRAARALFGGRGSLGNGAAMRVAPAAILAVRDLEGVAQLARQTAILTHTHELGVEGAVLQALALALLLRQEATTPLDTGSFLRELRARIRAAPYLEKLEKIELLLPGAERGRVVRELGTGTAALQAVPTAILCFLCSPQSFPQVILYAISLGGDTDTIASMAGALAGAYLGERSIPAPWRHQVEGGPRLRELADALVELAFSVPQI